MRGVSKLLVFVLFVVFIILLYFTLFSPSFLTNTKYVTNMDDYLNFPLILNGVFKLEENFCTLEKECSYNVIFVDDSSVFSNLSISKNNVEVMCFDEYSREPKKYIGITCGLKYIDLSVNKEKFEQINIDLLNKKDYNFTLQKNNSYYYLNLNLILIK